MLVLLISALVMVFQSETSSSFRSAMVLGWGLPVFVLVVLDDATESVFLLFGAVALAAAIQASLWTLVFYQLGKFFPRREQENVSPA